MATGVWRASSFWIPSSIATYDGVDLVVERDDLVGELEVAVLERGRAPPAASGGRGRSRPGARPRAASSSSWKLVRSAEAAGDVVLGALVGRVREDLRGLVVLDEDPVRGRRPSTSRLKNAVMSATRAACCMLWVTITSV